MEWVVQIEGGRFVLEELCRSLNSPELLVFKEGKEFFLKCDDFNKAEEAKDVLEIGRKLVPILSGATRLELGHPLRFGNVFRINDDGTLQEFGFFQGQCMFPKIAMRGAANGAQVSNIADNVEIWVKSAQKDEKIREALTLFGSIDLNWVILYKIFEIIEADIQTEIHQKGWGTKGAVHSFTQTAQPHRHSKHSERLKKWKSHDKPMRFDEAKAFIQTILENWIRTK